MSPRRDVPALTPPPSTPAMVRRAALAMALGALGCGAATSSTDAGTDAPTTTDRADVVATPDSIAPMPPPRDASITPMPRPPDSGFIPPMPPPQDSGFIPPMPPPMPPPRDSGFIPPMPPPMPPPDEDAGFIPPMPPPMPPPDEDAGIVPPMPPPPPDGSF